MCQVLILTEYGAGIGFGHLMRCQSLAFAFSDLKISTQLIIDGLYQTNLNIVNSEFLPWKTLPENIRIRLANAELILIDSFTIDKKIINQIIKINSQTAIIDDFPRRNYSQGIIIDWTMHAENRITKKNSRVIFLLGAKYAALRPAFWNPKTKSIRNELKSILVTFGGYDIRSLTRTVVPFLQKKFPKIRKLVVAGDFIDKLKMAPDNYTYLYNSCDAQQMVDLMDEADIAICGGGQTLYEMASLGLPSIAITLVDDQVEDIRGFSKIGSTRALGWWNHTNLLSKIENEINLLTEPETRKNMASAGQQAINGKGALTLAQKLIELTNLTRALT